MSSEPFARASAATLLIIDDDPLFCTTLYTTLSAEGYTVLVASTLAGARTLLQEQEVDIVFVNTSLPDGNGLALLDELSSFPEAPEIIIITSQSDPDGAATAISAGAWDYVRKHANMTKFILMVQRALQAHSRKRNLQSFMDGTGFIGGSAAMGHALLQMDDASRSDVPVLITGETGTGKEMLARIVHSKSRRAEGPFIVVDCGALSPMLLESELFGSVRGAFTGALHTRHGLVMRANQGTLFLDEVGELLPEQQKVFLRLLQERKFRRVGDNEELQSDFRIVAATNRSLSEMVQAGTFRSDLQFRLQGVLIETPPLRSRGRDILVLMDYALRRTLAKYRLKPKVFAAETQDAMLAYTWPGNVRELLHAVESAVLSAGNDPLVLKQHLPTPLRVEVMRTSIEGYSDSQTRALLSSMKEDGQTHAEKSLLRPKGIGKHTPGIGDRPRATHTYGTQLLPETHDSSAPTSWKEFQENELYQIKRRYLLHLMDWAQGNVPVAAKHAGVSRQRLYTLLRDHGISRQWQKKDM